MKAKNGVFTLLIAIAFMAIPVLSSAQDKLQIQSSDTIKSVLEKHVGKSVRVRVQSGEEIAGTVTKVGDHVVHLSELTGKEFFDAVVRIDTISAVIVRVRSK